MVFEWSSGSPTTPSHLLSFFAKKIWIHPDSPYFLHFCNFYFNIWVFNPLWPKNAKNTCSTGRYHSPGLHDILKFGIGWKIAELWLINVCPYMGVRVKSGHFWPITWPNVNIFEWTKKNNICIYNLLIIADLYVNISKIAVWGQINFYNLLLLSWIVLFAQSVLQILL